MGCLRDRVARSLSAQRHPARHIIRCFRSPGRDFAKHALPPNYSKPESANILYLNEVFRENNECLSVNHWIAALDTMTTCCNAWRLR